MAVNFITTNPVEAGWDRQQARTDAATQSELRRVQTGEAIEQTRQRRGETQAMTDALAGLPPDADHLATLRALSRAPGLLPTTRVQTMQAIAQIEQSRAQAARAERAQASRENYQDQRLAQGDRRIDERRDPVVPVQGEDGSTVYVPQSQAVGRRVGARPGGSGAPVIVQTPEGPRYMPRSDAVGQTPGRAPTGNEPMVRTQDENGNEVWTPRSQAAGQTAPRRDGAPVLTQGPNGEAVYTPRSQAIGRPAAPRPTGNPPNGPFPGNSMDATDRNILWRGNQPGGDTSSLEYYMAHQRYSQGRPVMVPSDPANPASPMVQAFIRPNMEGFAAPTYRQPGEAPAAPTSPAEPRAPEATPPTAPAAPTAPTQPRPTGPVVDRIPNTARVNPTTAEHLRTYEIESNRVIDALDNFDRLSRGTDGATRFNAWIGNPLSPQAAELQQAYQNMVMTLRSPAFANTGVLQPAEMAMLDRMLFNPATWRGAAMTPEARSRQLDQIRQMVRNGLVRQQQSIRNPGGQAPAAPAAPAAPEREMQFDSQGRRVTPGPRSDAGGIEQMAQAPATGPASDFGDGMGAGDRAQVPQPYRTPGLLRDDYGADVAPGQMMPGGFAPTGYRRESEYTNPGPSPQLAPQPERAPPAAPGAAAPRGQQALYGPSYVDTLFTQEGSGVNPRSSAAGYGQFLAGTWLGRPDAPGIFARLTQGNPNAQALLQRAWQGDQQAAQQILALRNNPEVARAAVGEYVRQTAATFRNAGVEVNDTNLALAHFFGPAGSVRFLRALQADPNTPITRIVPPAVLRANPGVLMPGGQPITAGALYAQYARRYGGQAPAQTAPADAMPPASDPAMGSNPDQNAGSAPLSAAQVQAAEPAMPSMAEAPPAPGPGAIAAPAAAAPLAAPVTTPPTPQAAAAPEAGAPMLSPLDTASPDQNQGAAPLAPQNGASAASPVPSGRREPTQQESLAADLRRVVGQMPTATPAAGPFALSDPATIREARTRFAESGRTADWNAGVASFLEDRFQRALEGAGSPHDFQRAVFASPRDRALLMATLAPEQQAAFRDLMRVADLASRGGAPGPIAQLAQGIRSGRGAGTLARLISDPDTVAQLRMLSQIAPDSPRALQIVNAILARTAAPEAAPVQGPGAPREIQFDSQGRRVSQ